MNENVNLDSQPLLTKGVATIEIFDAGGNVVDKQVRTNYVNPHYLKSTALVNNYLGKVKSSSELGSTLHHYYEASRGLVLTDNDSEINPEGDKFVKGSIKAYSRRDYTNTNSAVMGTYNTVESVNNQTYKRYVYDFGTNQANGTFSSIYTGYFSENSNYIYTSILPLWYSQISASLSNSQFAQYFKFHRGKLYGFSPSYAPNKIMVYDKFKNFYGSNMSQTGFFANPANKGSDVNIYESPVPFGTYNAFVGDYLYFFQLEVEKSVYVNKLYRYHLNHQSNPELVASFSREALGVSYNLQLTFMFYRPKTNKIICPFYQSSSASQQGVYEIDLNTHTIKLSNTLKYGMLTWIPEGHIDEDDYYYCNGEVYDFETSKKVSPFFREIWAGATSQISMYLGDISPSLSLYKLTDNSNFYLGVAPKAPFYSRVLLDSPVTKTSQNTMKITYEFTYPEIDVTKI